KIFTRLGARLNLNIRHLRSPPDLVCPPPLRRTAAGPRMVQIRDLRGSWRSARAQRPSDGQKCAVCRFRTHTFASSSRIFQAPRLESRVSGCMQEFRASVSADLEISLCERGLLHEWAEL